MKKLIALLMTASLAVFVGSGIGCTKNDDKKSSEKKDDKASEKKDDKSSEKK